MRAITFISLGVFCSWWLSYAPAPDRFRARTKDIFEPRAQRRGVTGLGDCDRPLTPLRCVRGSNQFDQTDVTQELRHCSPIDVALISNGRLALVANHSADSVSLVDLEQGKVLAEQACGRKPVAVAVSADGKRAAVSNLWSGSL